VEVGTTSRRLKVWRLSVIILGGSPANSNESLEEPEPELPRPKKKGAGARELGCRNRKLMLVFAPADCSGIAAH